jgi:hypothetical protein
MGRWKGKMTVEEETADEEVAEEAMAEKIVVGKGAVLEADEETVQ